jgi:hypothetical protein
MAILVGTPHAPNTSSLAVLILDSAKRLTDPASQSGLSCHPVVPLNRFPSAAINSSTTIVSLVAHVAKEEAYRFIILPIGGHDVHSPISPSFVVIADLVLGKRGRGVGRVV